MARPRRTPAAKRGDDELEPGDDNTLGMFQVPAILLEEDGPPNFECEEEIVTVAVNKAQEGVGFSWVGNCKPSDIPNPQELLARFGPGHYKLTGKCINGKIRRHRILSIGDWKPAGVAPTPPAAAPQLPGGSPAAGMLAFVTSIAAVLTPIIVPVITHMRESSTRAQSQVDAANNRLLEAIMAFGNGRASNSDELLKAAIANLAPQGGSAGPAGATKVWLDLLQVQREMLSKGPAKESQTEELIAVALAMFGGYNDTRRAEAEAKLAEIKARHATVTVTTTSEPAPAPTHTVIVGPDGKPPPVAPEANGAGRPA